ncbi:MAG: LysR family transcriptional regulator [Acholeplasmatales bacterium]|nr:LysR family transcriptional regulator [Acholeplasmatales bacterium]
MNIMYLKYAIEVAKVGSINKAAENLYIAQPNLSRAIKELESSLGFEIFERTSKGMVLTVEGDQLIRYAKTALEEFDKIEDMFKTNNKQLFSISVPRASYISYAFMKFSKYIDNDNPAEIFYKETNSFKAIENILDADYRLGIIRYASKYDKYFKIMLEEKGLEYELISEYSYKLIFNKNSSLADKEEIRYQDLKEYVEIAHADPYIPSMPLSKVRQAELPEDIDKRIYVFERGSQFDILSENENAFMWVSPLPKTYIDRYNLIQRECKDNDKVYRDVLIYKKGYAFTKLDKLFLTELTNAKREIFENK